MCLHIFNLLQFFIYRAQPSTEKKRSEFEVSRALEGNIRHKKLTLYAVLYTCFLRQIGLKYKLNYCLHNAS